MRETPEYRAWRDMRSRCSNPKVKAYPRYGGRGITVCERWDSFSAFLADVGPRPGPEYQIDRYPNNDGNYEPGNVRWATPEQNNNNRRDTRRVLMDGKEVTLGEACQRLGVSREVIRARVNRGQSWEQAIASGSRRPGRRTLEK